MTDMQTRYLGLELDNPLVVSASPLSRDVASAQQLEQAGAAALVMYSLFEEQLLAEEQNMERFFHHQDLGHGEASSFLPLPESYKSTLDQYLEQLQALKQAVDIPVIASLNGISNEGWIEYASELQDAGADALELNIYYIASNITESAEQVEQRYVDMLQYLLRTVQLPVAVKISSQFSSPLNLMRKLQRAGAEGVVLFNRLYQTDIDLETLQVQSHLQLSTPYEALERIRWTAIARGQLDIDLAVSGGFHRAEDIIKALMAGANVAQLCSTLLQHGPGRLGALLAAMTDWLDAHEYESLYQLQGSLSQKSAVNPDAYQRANYLQALDSFTPPEGVWY